MNDTKLNQSRSRPERAGATDAPRPRWTVFSGMRPTGRLHLGNYFGALRNWIDLQEKYVCYFCVVDWHMLTTGYADTSSLKDNVHQMVLDWLAAGLDPQKCVIFKQSDVIEHAELALLLSMTTPLSWLENNPTWKEQLQELAKTKVAQILESPKVVGGHILEGRNPSPDQEKIPGLVPPVGRPQMEDANNSLRTFGFLGYPVLQSADILLYNATKVPVGQDQLPHVELSREICRRFNSFFPGTFAEPEALLTSTPKVPGTDGRKMSKSYGNTIQLLESEDSLKEKTRSLYTDPTKIKATDPGHPEPCAENPPGCSAFALHKLYASEDFVKQRKSDCLAGKIGCVACKKDLLLEMSEPFSEFRERRNQLSRNPEAVSAILESGAQKAKAVASETMARVRRAMNLV